jgi:alanine dehydrogenase
MTLLLSEQDVDGLISVDAAIRIAEDAFRMAGERTAINPARTRMPFEKGFLQFGPAALLEKRVVGFKFWANFGYQLEGAQRQVWNFLYNIDSHELFAIIQAYGLGKYRTSAVSAVAAKYLSPTTASTVGLYGAGRYAEGQLAALCAVRPIKSVKVFSRTAEKREAFCRKMAERLHIDVAPVAAPELAARDAQIIVTMTDSDRPVLLGDWLPAACLVIAAGANHWYEREIDGRAVARARRVVVDELEQAKVESGDILWAVAHGLVAWNQVEQMGDIVAGRTGLDLNDGIILFESHGVAIQDVAIGLAAYEVARTRGLGRQVAL